jgi:hypothetical protein
LEESREELFRLLDFDELDEAPNAVFPDNKIRITAKRMKRIKGSAVMINITQKSMA